MAPCKVWGSVGGQGMQQISMAVLAGYTTSGMGQSRWKYRGKRSKLTGQYSQSFALYPALPDHPPIAELQSFVQNLFMEPFTKLGKVFDLNRNGNMWLIDKVFQKVGERDRKDAERYPAGFINVNGPYDRKHHAARYHFTQCPNAEFAKKHNLLHVLPLLCNCDFFGIEELHGKLHLGVGLCVWV